MTASRDALTRPLSLQVADSLQRHVRFAAAPALQPQARLCVGYSGGLDSSVLLHLLAALRRSAGFSLAAVHVHHGLSPQADYWADHCTQVCRELDVPLAIRRVAVRPAGEGLEAAARAARYHVFAQLEADFLVLAHHRDDQAETVLLQLLRGAGLKGLAAMPEARPLVGGLVLLRPLLAATRADIAAYAAAHGIGWIDDASNSDVRLARNALRHAVFPPLAECFPAASKVLALAAAQFAEAAALLDALAELDGRHAIAAEGLSIAALRDLPEPRARNLLRRFLEQAGVEIHQDAMHESLRQLLTARQDAQVGVAFSAAAGQVVLRRHRHWAMLENVRQDAAEAAAEITSWQGEACLDLGAAGYLHFQAVTGAGVRLMPGAVTIRRRLGGERLRPGPGRPRRTLKNLLREADIPAWQRAALPLIYLDEALVWAARIGADSDYLATTGEPGWLVTWQAEANGPPPSGIPDKAA